MSDDNVLYVIDGSIQTPNDTKALLEFGWDLKYVDLAEIWAKEIRYRFDFVVDDKYDYYTRGPVKGVICLTKTNSFPEEEYVKALTSQGFIVYPTAEIQDKIFGHYNVIQDSKMNIKLPDFSKVSVSNVFDFVNKNNLILTLAHPSTVDMGISKEDVKLYENLQKYTYEHIYYDTNAWVETLTKKSDFGQFINYFFPKAEDEYTTSLIKIASTDGPTPNLAFSGRNITMEKIDGSLESLKYVLSETVTTKVIDPIPAEYMFKKMATKLGFFKTIV